jgi:diguanylate cyclase (GGDEF)-like protein
MSDCAPAASLPALQPLIAKACAAQDLTAALASVVAALCVTAGWPAGQAWQPDAAGNLSLVTSWGPLPDGTEAPGRTLAAQAGRKTRPLPCRDLAGPGLEGMTAAIAVPVAAQQQLVTVLVFYMPALPGPLDACLSSLQEMAGYLGPLLLVKAPALLETTADSLSPARYDALTDLPNRTEFLYRLQQAIQAGQQQRQVFSLLFVELNKFREINYAMGHPNGDLVLMQVASRFKDLVGESALVARLGEVQFGILLPGADAGQAEAFARRLLAVMQKPFAVAAFALEVNASIGIACFPVHGEDGSRLLQHADVAMYLAKKAGREIGVYTQEQDPYNPRRLAMVGELRQAIAAGQLQLFCQPKIHLATARIVGAEALVRWQHPEYGLVSPAQFIPLIEKTGLINPLTRWMLAATIRQCALWRAAGHHVPVAVNLSTRDLDDPSLLNYIEQQLAEHQLTTDWIGLEITESNIMSDPDAARAIIQKLSERGFKLYVDDYGTGYSSLSYLMTLPVNVIKIDQSFVGRMPEDQGAATIVRFTIEMAHQLNMAVVAEGVKSRRIWEQLAALGCDEAQGQYISAPLPAGELMDWLAASNWHEQPPAMARP